MKSVFSVSSVLLALFLTACGGGGSSSTTAITSISNAVISPKPVQKVDGYSLTAKKDNRQAQPLTGSQGINTVTIDGKTLDFIPQGFIVGNNINQNAGNMTRIGSGNALSYMRYGYVADTAKNVSPTLFAQGIATASDKVPTTGKATYNGTAVDNNKVSYNARFDVNYTAKILGGTLSPQNNPSAKMINLTAVIKGNTFTGKSDYTTTGQFYGPNAEELGGVFKNHDDSLSGAFGAKK